MGRKYLKSSLVRQGKIIKAAQVYLKPSHSAKAHTESLPEGQTISPLACQETPWRNPMTRRSPLKRNTDRIDTDYILATTFVHDVNQMLDSMYGLQGHQVKPIMMAFIEDTENKGRKVTFLRDLRLGSWSIRLEDPANGTNCWHWRNYPNSYLRPPNRRPFRIDYGDDSAVYNKLPKSCEKLGCDAGCPIPRSKGDHAPSGKSPEHRMRQEDRETISSPPSSSRALSSSQQCPPAPRPKEAILPLKNVQRNAITVAKQPPDTPSKISADHLRTVVDLSRNRDHYRNPVIMKRYERLECRVQDATLTLPTLRKRNKILREDLDRAKRRIAPQFFQCPQRWRANPGATNNAKSQYHKITEVIVPAARSYDRRVPSLHRPGPTSPNNGHLLTTEADDAKGIEAASSTELIEQVSGIPAPKHQTRRKRKVHKRIEAWRIDPDKY